jgi:hypothetical protein
MFRHMAWSGGFMASQLAMNPSTGKCGYAAEAFSSWRLAGVAAQMVREGLSLWEEQELACKGRCANPARRAIRSSGMPSFSLLSVCSHVHATSNVQFCCFCAQNDFRPHILCLCADCPTLQEHQIWPQDRDRQACQHFQQGEAAQSTRRYHAGHTATIGS